ncbi:MAG: 16S rRNA (cytosine(1402)-N(4))-methyltransferase RsmH [Candidatus Moranbacteria bacterium]|nr:16S rRNA (cytosine(1402)-N(4))-methyltransferase RsmH [Candidatus Moranbacteria bacterium]NTW45671.1 16S rRNA (cytosine(1402)-N(4))-methyltransferase RsmH [Candidatus Moranbacteria bacterium]
MSKTRHVSVLLREAVDALNLQKGDTAVDATLGGGGHTREMLSRVTPGGRVVAFDADERAIERFLGSAESDGVVREAAMKGSLVTVGRNFSRIRETLGSLGIAQADAVLADFGFSSDQMDDPSRGFSFRMDGPLDMRLDPRTELTAERVVNGYDESRLVRILREYGDEPKARKIAGAIISRRSERPFRTTTDLSETVAACFSPEERRGMGIHPATRTFQGIRIEVNGELAAIESFLREAVPLLRKGGRIAVITFHSGEDALVKRIFGEMAKGCVCPPEFPACVCGRKPLLRLGTPRFVVPTAEETAENPRARSAKLRFAERV